MSRFAIISADELVEFVKEHDKHNLHLTDAPKDNQRGYVCFDCELIRMTGSEEYLENSFLKWRYEIWKNTPNKPIVTRDPTACYDDFSMTSNWYGW